MLILFADEFCFPVAEFDLFLFELVYFFGEVVLGLEDFVLALIVGLFELFDLGLLVLELGELLFEG